MGVIFYTRIVLLIAGLEVANCYDQMNHVQFFDSCFFTVILLKIHTEKNDTLHHLSDIFLSMFCVTNYPKVLPKNLSNGTLVLHHINNLNVALLKIYICVYHVLYSYLF